MVSKYEAELESMHYKHLLALLANSKISEAEWIELVDEAANQFEEEWD